MDFWWARRRNEPKRVPAVPVVSHIATLRREALFIGMGFGEASQRHTAEK